MTFSEESAQACSFNRVEHTRQRRVDKGVWFNLNITWAVLALQYIQHSMHWLTPPPPLHHQWTSLTQTVIKQCKFCHVT